MTSARIIGYASSLGAVLTIIVVTDSGVEYGASGGRSNDKDRTHYYAKEQ